MASVRGDVYTWLRADDRLEADALQSVDTLLASDPEFNWVLRAVSLLHEDGVLAAADPGQAMPVRVNALSRELVAAGYADAADGALIQQEGTFWTDSLWVAAVSKERRGRGPQPTRLVGWL